MKDLNDKCRDVAYMLIIASFIFICFFLVFMAFKDETAFRDQYYGKSYYYPSRTTTIEKLEQDIKYLKEVYPNAVIQLNEDNLIVYYPKNDHHE